MNVRAIATVGLAVLLVLSLALLGSWILGFGAPGATMMNGQAMAGPMNPDMMGQDHLMGPASNRGALGGYAGALGIVMVLFILGAVGLLLATYLWERPGRPEAVRCPFCQRPVDTDWASCAYCGESLAPAAAGEAARGGP